MIPQIKIVIFSCELNPFSALKLNTFQVSRLAATFIIINVQRLNSPLYYTHFGVCLQFLCSPWTEHFSWIAPLHRKISSLIRSMDKMTIEIFTTIQFVRFNSFGISLKLNHIPYYENYKKKEKIPTANSCTYTCTCNSKRLVYNGIDFVYNFEEIVHSNETAQGSSLI